MLFAKWNMICMVGKSSKLIRKVKFLYKVGSSIEDDRDKNNDIIVGGYYNCTMNNELDRCNCTTQRDIGQIDLMDRCRGLVPIPKVL